MSNSTCPVQTAQSPPSLFQNGNLVFQAHHVGWLIAGIFTVIATITSFWLVNKHLLWYTNKHEQRYIVRLLFMVPLYATISLASYLWWNHSTPLLLIRDAYESTVLTAFFYLLLTYLSPNPDDQKAIFHKVGLSRAADAEAIAKGEEPKKWVFPLGFVKAKPADGLYFLQMMKWGVLQYCVIRPCTTLAAVSLNYIGWYCDGSFNPRFGYVYITVIVSISVSIAMYCLIQLYIPIAVYLAPQKPLLKLFAIKAVVFLTFWQSTFLSCLSLFGVVKNTTYMTADDINIGIAALLETFEMMLFAFLHLRAFSYKPYKPFHDPRSKVPPPTPTPRWRSLGHAFDFRETFREIHAGWVYITDKIRGREPTPDHGARRVAHYANVFERPRQSHLPTDKSLGNTEAEKGLLSPSGVQLETPPWLEIPGRNRREKSEALEVQIEKELERRGYGSHIPGRGHIGPAPDADGPLDNKRQRSWWRSVYSRVSQSGPEPDDEQWLTPQPSKPKKSKSKSKSRPPGSRDFGADRSLLFEHDYDFDDPPPQPILNSHRSRRQDGQRSPLMEDQLDTLAPLSGFRDNRSSHQTKQSKQRNFSNPTPSQPSTLPPTSSLSPPKSSSRPMQSTSQHPFTRSDSLLGRVFPPSASNPSSVGQHGSDSGRSLPSTSVHGAPASRMTPRGRLILTTPQILGKQPEQQSRSYQSVEHPTPPPLQAPLARSEEVLHVPEPPREWIGQGSHIRESALLGERPALTLNVTTGGLVTSSSSDDFAGHNFDPPVPRLPDPSQKAKRPNGLRRQSAQIYSPDSPSRRGRRQSVDVTSPQIPETSYTPPTSSPRNQDRNGKRRQSAPLDAAPYHEQALRRSGYQVENMHSSITQPSLSGTPFAVKYPTVIPPSRELPIEARLPQPPTSTQPLVQYSPSREDGKRTRGHQSGEQSSRPREYMTPTTRP
ncbi:organic solute transporter Ostalpha-domain-containing protein [Mycena haematopus]|nr:organic solute transporter Ostalpha-domain-containing protein [Mycena haematopus]